MKKFWTDEGGAVATEYALLVTFIAFLIVAGVAFFGGELNQWFTTAGDTVNGMAQAATT